MSGERKVGCSGFQPHHLGQPEVGDLHAALRIDEDVFRFDIAVDDAAVVGELERLADLRDDGQRLLWAEVPAALELPQVGAVHELHHQIGVSTGLAEVVDADNVRVAELGQGAGLALEALAEGRVFIGLRGQDLERHESVEARLSSLVNRAHAAPA